MSPKRLPELPGAEVAADLAGLSGSRRVEPEQLQQVLAECDARVREVQAAAARDAQTLAGIELTFDALADLAHKINNPLTSLLGRAQILQMKKDLDPQVLKASQVIEESAKRVAEHIRELNQLIRASRESLRPNAEIAAPAAAD